MQRQETQSSIPMMRERLDVNRYVDIDVFVEFIYL